MYTLYGSIANKYLYSIISVEGIPIFEELFQHACPKFISASGRLDGTPRAVSFYISHIIIIVLIIHMHFTKQKYRL